MIGRISDYVLFLDVSTSTSSFITLQKSGHILYQSEVVLMCFLFLSVGRFEGGNLTAELA